MTKILLVEDEVMLRDAFTILLKANAFDIDAAANGAEALELCKKEQYDLILLDLMMPVLDGVGFLEQANLKENYPNTNVVILSNLSSGEMVQRAFELGAHRHEVKSNLAPQDIIKLVNDELATAV